MKMLLEYEEVYEGTFYGTLKNEIKKFGNQENMCFSILMFMVVLK